MEKDTKQRLKTHNTTKVSTKNSEIKAGSTIGPTRRTLLPSPTWQNTWEHLEEWFRPILGKVWRKTARRSRSTSSLNRTKPSGKEMPGNFRRSIRPAISGSTWSRSTKHEYTCPHVIAEARFARCEEERVYLRSSCTRTAIPTIKISWSLLQ